MVFCSRLIDSKSCTVFVKNSVNILCASVGRFGPHVRSTIFDLSSFQLRLSLIIRPGMDPHLNMYVLKLRSMITLNI